MAVLNFAALAEQLLRDDKLLELIKYIDRVQGAELRRLDYSEAAVSIGVSSKTVSRYCSELAAKGIIIFEGKQLRLSANVVI